ncbi:MAG: NTP transferase domain-containing protein [Lachnospiraceae bacterium]|nr:NTP transferase domain-containing protein [Lachnospiraceae bacterium]MDD3796352.1 NTP transferase domain-containing protein [Lachnospiraceae bacterium]
MKTGAVIIAAGITSSEEGFQPLKPVGKLTRVERIILNFQKAGIEDIVIVTGNRAEELERSLKQRGVVFLYNREYERTEMFDSAKIGFRYMQGICRRVLFTTVNVPLFTEATLEALLKSPAQIAIPVYQGHRGHPVALRLEAMKEILEYSGAGGLRGAIAASEYPADWIETKDPGILKQTGQTENYQEILEYHNEQLMHMNLDIGLVRESRFFDSLTAALLKQIDTAGSVREACTRLNISYSKGFQMLAAAETELDCALTERQQGGKYGGKTFLTKQGREFLDKYEHFRQEVYHMADKKFREIFVR